MRRFVLTHSALLTKCLALGGQKWQRILLSTAAGLMVISPALAQVPPVPESAAQAQSPALAAPALSEIEVTASRIDRAGFKAPTPVTVVTSAELQVGQRNNLGAALDDLPSFRATTSPMTQPTGIRSSTTTADLRGLGASRTLVLVDGHRFIGDQDLDSVPFALVSRVDVLTGGASASWGSGAVAGVVNIILNNNLVGGRFSASYGESTRGDGREERLSAAYGFRFADGRGHLMFASEFVNNDGIFTKESRGYVARNSIFANPNYAPGNGQHQFTILPNVNSDNVSFGGVIDSGILKGQTFNSNGTLRPFQYGPLVSGTLEQGGEGPSDSDFAPLSPPLKRYNLSSAGNFELTDHVNLYGNVMVSRLEDSYGFYPESDQGNITISADNAFLSDTIKQQLAAANQTSFLFGRYNLDFGFISLNYRHDIVSSTIGLNGDFGSNWRWDAYYSHGVAISDTTVGNLRITNNYAQAIDAVLSPTTGQPVCRVALTNPTTACVPIDLFGYGAPSQAALNYVLGSQTENDRQSLDVGGASIRGEPFSLPAGAVSVAFGAEGRRESLRATVTPLAAANAFTLVNFGAKAGSFNVREAFTEVIAPLLKDLPLAKLVDFNGGYRLSDYSNTGSISSWKLGLTDQVAGDFRLRGVVSRDIRSASLIELFQTPLPNYIPFYDPEKKTEVLAYTLGGGNANLRPETAHTYTLGGVFSPSWASRLNLSVDYYNISISNVITTLAGQDILNRCAAGNAALCSHVVRDASGNLVRVNSSNLNLSNYKTSGLDFEASYALPLDRLRASLPGTLTFRVLATNVLSLTTNDGIHQVNYLGSLGKTSTFGEPKWRGLASATYELSKLTVDMRARFVGPGVYDRTMDISNNAIAAHTELDLSGQYELGAWNSMPITIFASVRNIFNSTPPILANPVQYDLIGRYATAGLKARW